MGLPLTVKMGGVAGTAGASAAFSVGAGLEQAASASNAPTAMKRMAFI
jgi:hypothetical protein